MANHRAAATLLVIASLLVAVALSGADARPTVHPNKTAALRGANVSRTGRNTGLTVHRDTHGRAPTVLEPECEELEPELEPEPKEEPELEPKEPKEEPEPEAKEPEEPGLP